MKMGTKIEYVDTTHLYATKYIRNSKAIAVLWAIFTICYAIIGIVAFVTPEWIGDPDNESAGRLGLWQVCQKDEIFDNCKRRWEKILTVPTFSFQLATLFMGASVLLALLTICFLIFVIFMKSTRVFHICGWLQIISVFKFIIMGSRRKITAQVVDMYERYFSLSFVYGKNWTPFIVCTICICNLSRWGRTGDALSFGAPMIWSDLLFYIIAVCMIVACGAFPFGWNSDDFRKICGPEANRFELGLCGIRWAYLLAIIGCIDGVVLATLAFILATRHVRLQPDPLYQNSLFKGEINNSYITDAVSLAGSRKNLNLQPILLVAPPGDDTISQFSSRTPNHRYNRPDYHNSMHQF